VNLDLRDTLSYRDEQLLKMVIIQRHLVNVSESAPIYKMTDQAC